jgi:hypothetical protein
MRCTCRFWTSVFHPAARCQRWAFDMPEWDMHFVGQLSGNPMPVDADLHGQLFLDGVQAHQWDEQGNGGKMRCPTDANMERLEVQTRWHEIIESLGSLQAWTFRQRLSGKHVRGSKLPCLPPDPDPLVPPHYGSCCPARNGVLPRKRNAAPRTPSPSLHPAGGTQNRSIFSSTCLTRHAVLHSLQGFPGT